MVLLANPTPSLVAACVVIGAVFAFASAVTFVFVQGQAVKEFLRPHAGYVCPVCHFGLHALPDETTCPECGTSVTRAGVIAMWQRAFRTPLRYPRTNRYTRGHDAVVPAPPAEVSPWHSWTLRQALASIEAGAAARGFAGVRLAPDAVTFDAPLMGKGKRPLPAEVYSLLAWADEHQWRAFVAPMPGTESDDEQVASITLRSSDRVRVLTVLEHAADDADLKRFVEAGGSYHQSDWRETQFIAFADVCDGRVIYFATDPPNVRAGSIVAIDRTRGEPVCLGEGMGQWLTRVAACNGIDVALFPHLLPRVPGPTRPFLEAEFASVLAGGARKSPQ